jgi:predicted metal-dependent HD superfamily phosphohydrolase
MRLNSCAKTICLLALIFLSFSFQNLFGQSMKDTNDVKKEYLRIVNKQKPGKALAAQCWNSVAALYSDSSRHYHTLQHLANFYNELLRCKNDVNDWDAVFLSMVYHDVIYVSIARDNEEKSADMAADHLKQFGFSQPFINTCRQLIMATKTHKATHDLTTDLFIDADMSILGVPLEKYKVYVQQVHQEYAAVPNFTERRKGFLKGLLGPDHLFITPQFYKLYEQSARYNIQQEITDFQ